MILQEFSKVNLQRCLKWHPAGIDSWSLSDWAVAAAGEMGEACDVIKKLNRLRDGLVGNKAGQQDVLALNVALGDEIADAVIYLDLLAQRAGLSLARCVAKKFNAVSERNGFSERIEP